MELPPFPECRLDHRRNWFRATNEEFSVRHEFWGEMMPIQILAFTSNSSVAWNNIFKHP